MKVLIIAPSQDGIKSQPEIIDIARGNEPTILNGYVSQRVVELSLDGSQYDIIHFIQHGTRSGLQMSDGKVFVEWLIHALNRQQGLFLVVINSCDSVVIGAAIHNEIGCPVIAHAAPIDDDAARAFSGALYSGLKDMNVNDAFEYARDITTREYPDLKDVPVLINGNTHYDEELIKGILMRLDIVEREIESQKRTPWYVAVIIASTVLIQLANMVMIYSMK